MAASITVEEESGLAMGQVHRHNGYWAGDFTVPVNELGPAVLPLSELELTA